MNRPTQEERVLARLVEARGGWVSAAYFNDVMRLSQAPRAIFNLRHKRAKYRYEGEIETSPFKDEWGWCSYRLNAGMTERVRMINETPAREAKEEKQPQLF